MTTEFSEKVIAVTGAANGIGLAICRRFGRSGGRIALIDIDAESAHRQAKALQAMGIEAAAFPCDISREEDVRMTIQSVINHYEGIEFLSKNLESFHLPVSPQNSIILRFDNRLEYCYSCLTK